MDYQFRQLSATDIFPMATIISKIGIKEFKTAFENDGIKKIIAGNKGKSKDDLNAAVGIAVMLDLGGVVLANIGKCQNEIFAFLASVTETDEAEIRKLPLADFAELVISFFKKDELRDFIQVVSKFLK